MAAPKAQERSFKITKRGVAPNFVEPYCLEGGFGESPIKLNRVLGTLETWNEEQILARANDLAEKAINIWKFPEISQEILSKYSEMEDDEDEDEDEDEEPTTPQWDARFDRASKEVKSNINSLISKITEKFGCISEPHSKWLYFYTEKPTERKNMLKRQTPLLTVRTNNIYNMLYSKML